MCLNASDYRFVVNAVLAFSVTASTNETGQVLQTITRRLVDAAAVGPIFKASRRPRRQQVMIACG